MQLDSQKMSDNKECRSDYVFLAQTDTTVGFLSKDPFCINQKKGAKHTKPLLQEVCMLKNVPGRIPVSLRQFVRKARKTSFILPNNRSFRVIHDGLHKEFLCGFKTLYSSSANKTGEKFLYDFAYKKADIIVYDKRGLFEKKGSTIIKIRQNILKKIR